MITEKAFIPNMLVMPNLGSFSSNTQSDLIWDVCKEEFEKKIKKNDLKSFFFMHKNKFEEVRSFINKTEKILDIENIKPCDMFFPVYGYTKFSKTNLPTVLMVSPSLFLRSCPLRTSLFLILMRCGLQYDIEKDNYENTLFLDNYIKMTELAVKRFMFGFNVCKIDSNKGWVDTFLHATENKVKNNLKSYENKNFLLNSIWS